MILDFGTELATNFSLTAANAFTASPAVYDLGSKLNIGLGQPLWVQFQVTETFQSATSAQLQVGVVLADSANLITNPLHISRTGSAFVAANFSSPFYTSTNLPLGTLLYAEVSAISRAVAADTTFTGGVAGYLKRYLAAAWCQPLFATATFTAGKMSARVVMEKPNEHGNQEIYPTSFKVV